jgi:hypothetical protein
MKKTLRERGPRRFQIGSVLTERAAHITSPKVGIFADSFPAVTQSFT